MSRVEYDLNFKFYLTVFFYSKHCCDSSNIRPESVCENDVGTYLLISIVCEQTASVFLGKKIVWAVKHIDTRSFQSAAWSSRKSHVRGLANTFAAINRYDQSKKKKKNVY